MATGEKISAQAVATTWSGSDLATIVQSGVNKSITHDVLMDDTQICKAWVNFNGTGVVAIRDDFNVSSITDNGTGDYTVNFTNALDDANYSPACMIRTTAATGGPGWCFIDDANPPTAAALRVIIIDKTNTVHVDSDYVSIQIFGS